MFLPRRLIVAAAGGKHKRLVLQVLARSSSREQKGIQVLVDTGAEVNLVRPGLFGEKSFQMERERLHL